MRKTFRLDEIDCANCARKLQDELARVDGVDAVVLPGTKNTISDLRWMDERGISDRLRELRGKVPIVGICGGYQMMGTTLDDSQGIEGGVEGHVAEGLGFFDNFTTFGEYSKRIVNNTAEMLVGEGGEVTGYELHMGVTDVHEKPLFRMTNRFGPDAGEEEGSVREDEMLFGTYQHGIFDKMPFRKYFLSFVSHDGERPDTSDVRDYDDIIEENIDRLADVFEENLDIPALLGILGVSE